jgi:hypothetical protein
MPRIKVSLFKGPKGERFKSFIPEMGLAQLAEHLVNVNLYNSAFLKNSHKNVNVNLCF